MTTTIDILQNIIAMALCIVALFYWIKLLNPQKHGKL